MVVKNLKWLFILSVHDVVILYLLVLLYCCTVVLPLFYDT